jgi:hypothetical protein
MSVKTITEDTEIIDIQNNLIYYLLKPSMLNFRWRITTNECNNYIDKVLHSFTCNLIVSNSYKDLNVSLVKIVDAIHYSHPSMKILLVSDKNFIIDKTTRLSITDILNNALPRNSIVLLDNFTNINIESFILLKDKCKSLSIPLIGIQEF